MKTIKIMIAASEEMHDEKLEFTNLIEHLNEVLEPRGIELKRIKWNPETDGSIDEYKAKLKECEMCLTLYWRDMAGNSEQELDTAYHELKDGNNPRNLYVFFKEPTEDLTEALKDFKANFVTKYGHFFCKFENVDTMNLHFILQFEAYQNGIHNDLVKVKDGKIIVGNKEFVRLENIPFAALNSEYQRLYDELVKIDEEISKVSAQYATNIKDKELFTQLTSLGNKRELVSGEFEKYQKHLYDIALNFSKLSKMHCSERMRKAREQFESGNAIEADKILNIEEMNRETEDEINQYNQQKSNLEQKLEEYLLKAELVMSNSMLSVSERINIACESYNNSIRIASILDNEDLLSAVFLYYANFLYEQEYRNNALEYYKKAMAIYEKNSSAHIPDLAFMWKQSALIYQNDCLYTETENAFNKSLALYEFLLNQSNDEYLSDIAWTKYDMAVFYMNNLYYSEAVIMYKDAIRLFQRLGEDTYRSPILFARYYLTRLREFMNRDSDKMLEMLGILPTKSYHDLEKQDEDIDSLITMYEGYLKNLRQDDNKSNIEDLALCLFNLGALRLESKLNSNLAETEIQEAADIYRGLSAKNPNVYFPKLISTLNHLGKAKGVTEASESLYKETIELTKLIDSQADSSILKYRADSYSCLAELYDDQNKFPEAEEYYEKSLDIYRELYNKNNRMFANDLIRVLISLIWFHSDQYKSSFYRDCWEVVKLRSANKPHLPLKNKIINWHNFFYLITLYCCIKYVILRTDDSLINTYSSYFLLFVSFVDILFRRYVDFIKMIIVFKLFSMTVNIKSFFQGLCGLLILGFPIWIGIRYKSILYGIGAYTIELIVIALVIGISAYIKFKKT